MERVSFYHSPKSNEIHGNALRNCVDNANRVVQDVSSVRMMLWANFLPLLSIEKGWGKMLKLKNKHTLANDQVSKSPDKLIQVDDDLIS